LGRRWRAVLSTGNLPAGAAVDPVSRWLLATRASVFSMTVTSAAIGGLLAASRHEFHWLPFVLAAIGLLLSHAVNNMTNDLLDFESGVDTPDYARAQYAPHPLLSGLVSRRVLISAIILANALAVAVAAYLTLLRGWPVVAFAVSGFLISFFYVAPPFRLKHHGLGEPAVFLVWGPLMIGGTYFVTAGTLDVRVFLASVPYALLVTSVLVGKHLDKYEQDREKGIHTLVVLLGSRTSLALNRVLFVAFYVSVLLAVLLGVLGVWTLAVVLSLPRLRAVLGAYSRPKPSEPPPGYPIWPLWFVAWAFVLNRPAGYLLVLGLVLNALLPVYVPWFH
jgi:1,4-dihydroxy-2-naphthoate octaprenyltransferase